ncbi:kinase-like domain-containing protein [Hyaloraphidium curvatum]|nr:kinase-like domain-containing protein [Hyaloraphidium curvatum]
MKKFFGIGRAKEDKDARRSAGTTSNAPGGPTKEHASYWVARLAGKSELVAQGESIGDSRAGALAEALKGNTALKSLNLSGNFIGDQGARALAEFLKGNSTLTYLDLRNNGIHDAGGRALLSALEHNLSLNDLNVDGNRISLSLLWEINNAVTNWGRKERALQARRGLVAEHSREVEPHRQIGVQKTTAPGPTRDHATYWVTRLAGKTELVARGESIGDSRAGALAEALKGNAALSYLNLTGNSIGDRGARALAEMLMKNMALTKLYLAYNSIGENGGQALLSALELNSSLKELDLANNRVSSGLLEQIKKAVEDPSRNERALQRRRNLDADGRREADQLQAAERARQAEKQRLEAERQAALQRHREADEAEAHRRKQQQLEEEARARQAQAREAEIARRLEELRVREQEVERKLAETEEKAKQARGGSGGEPPIIPRSATDPASPAGEGGSAGRSYEIDPSHLQRGDYLGAGGFGTVIEGTYQKHTKVALKMIHGSNLSGRQLERAIVELEREMDVWSRLPYHINVLPLMGWCRKPLCLVTLLMSGGTSKVYLSRLKPKAYEPHAVHRLLFQVALGMNHLHSLPTPILHLDLKGDNVLVDENGVAKISDFGMSKIRATASLHSTKRSGGTPVFMAPETFARPRPKPGTATDVYAFGMTMWELLSEGDIPLGDELMDEELMIPGHGVDLEAFGARLRSDPGFRPERSRGIPDATWGLMQRCWAMDAADRPAFGEVADELKRVLDAL